MINQCGPLFLSFCRALDEYCDQIGVHNPRGGTARILHDAAYNTMAQTHTVTPAVRRHMAMMEHNIPDLFAGLVEIYSTDGFLKTVNRMSDMSLAQVAAAITHHRHTR